MKLFGSISELVKLVLRKNNNTVTIEPASGTAATDDVTYRLPADAGPATLELTTNTSPQTLTGKTVVVASNTITTAASGNLEATELNAALAELQTDIDEKASVSAFESHEEGTAAHGTTGDIVGTSDTQTLTNKTISAADNTVTGITDSSIATGAGISVTKIGVGQVNGPDFEALYGAGDTGYTIQEQLDWKASDEDLSDHTSSASAHGVGSEIVGTTDAQGLENKTFDDEIRLVEIGTPDAPAAGVVALYAKSDGNIYKQADDGVEELVNAGGVTYEETTVTLSSSGSQSMSGEIRLARTNNLVTMSFAGLTHSSPVSSATSAAGVIPVAYRPTKNGANVMYSYSSGGIQWVAVQTDGALQFQYRDWSGGSTNTRGSTSSGTISYLTI